MNEVIVTIDGRQKTIGAPYTRWEQLQFEMCLVKLGLKFTSIQTCVNCLSKMHDMTLQRQSLISLAIRAMPRSMRLSYYCFCYLLALPDELLEKDVNIYGKFGVMPDSLDIRGKIENCMKVISACFPFKTRGDWQNGPGDLHLNYRKLQKQ